MRVVMAQIGLERVIMRGKLRVSWKPLMDEVPLIGAVKVSMLPGIKQHVY